MIEPPVKLRAGSTPRGTLLRVEPGRSPEQMEARINDVAARIFKNYPPRK
jgi:hypothetical protein